MPSPPMNDKVTLHSNFDEEGVELGQDKRGMAITRPLNTRARVERTAESVIDSKGFEKKADLKITFPSSIRLQVGDLVEWIDWFGIAIKMRIEAFEEVLSYNGKQVYFRTAYTSKPRN